MDCKRVEVSKWKSSLIVPTLNAQDEIVPLLNALKQQSVQVDEIVIVDSASTDGTIETIESMVTWGPSLTILKIKRRDFDHGGTRHYAIEKCHGEIVLCMSQDAVPSDGKYIERLIACLNNPSIAMVSGRQLPKQDARHFERLVRGFNYPCESNVRTKDDIQRLGIKAFFASDVCAAFRRSAYFEVDGYPRPCVANEDMLLAARFLNAGYAVAYDAAACVYHSHNYTFRQQYKRNKISGFALAKYSELLSNASGMGEGLSLVKAVSGQLLRSRDLPELAAFGLDCVARALGNWAGRRQGAKVRKCGRP